ncbi:MAG: DUF2207 domain-containing protein [Armatimonadota bacterium]
MVACCLLALLGTGLWITEAAAKSYTFSRVEITAEVGPDGAMRITEERTYDLRGAFTWATYTLKLRGSSGVSDITVSDEAGPYRQSRSRTPRTYEVAVGADEMHLRLSFQAADQRKTFLIRYVLRDVVTRYSDVAELYWKFIGTGWDVQSDEVLVTVLLPGALRQNIKAWGHGSLHGRVEIQDGRVVLRVRGLPARTMVEGRILFPARLIPGRPALNEVRLPRIVAEETRVAAEANRLRWLHLANLASVPLLPLFALALYLWIFLGHGREHRPRFEGDYLRELPRRYPPAVLGTLWRFGTPGTQDFAATLLDLARRGYITIQERGNTMIPGDGLVASLIRERLKNVKTYAFARTEKPDDDLADLESDALQLMFRNATGATVTSWSLAHGGSDFRKGYLAWLEHVKQAARAHALFDGESDRMRRRVIVAGLLLDVAAPLVVIAGTFTIAYQAWGTFAGLLVAGLLLLILSPHIRRRSLEGATQFAEWQAFRRFLTDFSQLKDAPPPAIAVWEHYLPYAVTLGVAQEVLRQLPIVYGTVADASPSWFTSDVGGGSAVGDFTGSLSSMTVSLSTMVAGAVSPSSGGDGGGGGFSGGDDGGGGGGGGGGSGGSAG